MHTFYDRLVRAIEIYDPHLEPLARLTRLDPARVHNLQSTLSWSDWPTTTA
jgi:hypothetical protein